MAATKEQIDRLNELLREGSSNGLDGEQARAYAVEKFKTELSAPTQGEAAGKSLAQGVSMGLWDEAKGVAGAIANAPRRIADAVKAGPFGAPGGVVDDYRSARDAERDDDAAARKAWPTTHFAGRVVGGIAGGVAASAALPFAAPTTLGGAATAGAGYGAISGLGESEADLTKGDIGGAAVDTGVGGAVGAVGGMAAHGLVRAYEGGKRLAAALGASKITGAMSKYLENLINKGGSPAAIKQTAGRLFEQAKKEAGDTPLEAVNFAKLREALAEEASNPAAGDLNPGAKEIIDAIDKMRARGAAEGGGTVPTMTLAEMQNALHSWGLKFKSWKIDPSKQRYAKMAKDALDLDLEEATKNTALGSAAQVLRGARTEYGRAARLADLQKVITKSEDALSLNKSIDPGKFAAMNSGANRAKVEPYLRGDEELSKRWWGMVDAAKIAAKKGKSWFPEGLVSPKVSESVDRLFTYRNILKVLGDDQSAKDFARLMSPDVGKSAKEVTAIITRLGARLTDAPEMGRRIRIEAFADDDDMPDDVASAVGMR